MLRNLEILLIIASLTWSLTSLAQNRCDVVLQTATPKAKQAEKQIILEEIHALQIEITKPTTSPELLPLLKKQYQTKINEFEIRYGSKPNLRNIVKKESEAPAQEKKNDIPNLKKLYFELEHKAFTQFYFEALDKLVFSGESFTSILDLSTGSQLKLEGTSERFSTETNKIVLTKKTNSNVELRVFDLKKMQLEPTVIKAESLLNHEGPSHFIVYQNGKTTMNVFDLRSMSNIYENLENPGNFPLISNDGSRMIWKIDSDRTIVINGTDKRTYGAVELGNSDLEWIVYRNQGRKSSRYYLLKMKDETIVDLGEHNFGTHGSFSPDGKFFVFEDSGDTNLVKVIRLDDLAREEYIGQNPRIYNDGFYSYQVFNGPLASTLFLNKFANNKTPATTFSAAQNFEQIDGRLAYFYDGTQYVLVDIQQSREVGKLPFQPGDIKSYTPGIYVINGWINAAIFYSNNQFLDLKDSSQGSLTLIPLPNYKAVFNFDSKSNSLQLIEYKSEM